MRAANRQDLEGTKGVVMIQTNETGVRLVRSSERPAITDPVAINRALAPYGSRIWSLDLGEQPDDIRELLDRITLDSSESTRVRDHYLLSRGRLLELIEEAGRTPQVPGGGEMSTLDVTHNVRYPELYVVVQGVDYSRFDRFHVNASSEGIGVDEVMQVICGGGVRLLQHLPDHGLVTLDIDCVEDKRGWLITYDGGYPHIGSISEARQGTKVLMQIIGPARWEMRYEESRPS